MQWIIAFIAAVIAAAAEESIVAWAIIGYLIGYVLNLNQRTGQLERQLSLLRNELTHLKQSPPLPTVTALTTPATPPDTIIPPVAEITGLATELPPLIFTQKPIPKSQFLSPDATDSKPKSASINIDPFFRFIWQWLSDGNTFVRIGIIILFVGVSFLLNLAIDRGYIAIELRLAAVALGAIGLLAGGWHLKQHHGGYGLLLQGGGIGLLYLTIFASYNMYQLLPALLAFALLIAVVSLAAALAVLQNTLSLALFGSIGGFLAPFLTASDSHNYLSLFGFYALLNTGIFTIAWFKAWRVLNLVGLGFTFSIAWLWGVFSYSDAFFLHIELFLLLFFLFYVAIGILYADHRALNFNDYVDGTLIFATPILVFALQTGLVKQYEYGIAFSAIAVGGFYLALASWVWKTRGTPLKFLSEALLAIGVIFITLAIPYAIDGVATSATWVIESTGVLWISIRQPHFVRRLFALSLQCLAGLAFLSDANTTDGLVFANRDFIGVLVISICAGLSSWLLSTDFNGRHTLEKILSPWLLGYSLVWLFLGFDVQIEGHQLKAVQNPLMLGLTCISTAGLSLLGHRLHWIAAKYAALAMLVPLILGALITNGIASHPGANGGWILWPLAFTALYWHLYQLDTPPILIYSPLSHNLTFLLATSLLTWEIGWHLLNLVPAASGWFIAYYPLIASAALWGIMQPICWPLTRHSAIYCGWSANCLRGGLICWSVLELTYAADSHPLLWLPLFNPVEFMQSIVLITLLRFTFLMPTSRLSAAQKTHHYRYVAYFIFICLNIMLLRTLHHWNALPWSQTLLTAAISQTCLSIFWTLTGLGLTWIATQKQRRNLWIAGASLLSLVVIKLFFFDLHLQDAIERIISFITVGMLLMLIGYFAPLPPKIQDSKHTP